MISQSTISESSIATVGTHIKICEKLGSGSYGSVHRCIDEHGKNMAIKCCNTTAEGIPYILEAAIMASFSHPNLNRAARIHSTSDTLYIIQDLARCDLHQYTRRERDNHKPSPARLRDWAFSLTQAVACLHRQNIIHADIKASNVLLFENDVVKLADFSLSVRKWNPNETFDHAACTCTHRPLECFLGRPWDEKLDIWSLGVTFFELAYGMLPFPFQGTADDRRGDKDQKRKVKQRFVNCLIDWGTKGLNPPETIDSPMFPISFHHFTIPPEFHEAEYTVFNTLLLAMLNVNPDKRPTITEVLEHPYFLGFSPTKYMVLTAPSVELSSRDLTKADRYITRYTDNSTVKTVALELYSKCQEIEELSESNRAIGCTWMAAKMVLGYAPRMTVELHQVMDAERIIAAHLNFRLHIPKNDGK